jgi:hypothetical protein
MISTKLTSIYLLCPVTAILKGEILPFEEQELPFEPESEPGHPSDKYGSSDEYSSSSSSEAGQHHNSGLRSIRALVASIEKKPAITLPNPIQREEGSKRRPQSKTEVDLSQDAVKDIISSLYKIATVIRRPPPADRHIKSIDIDVHHFAEFDQRYVCDKFPSADPEVLARLGKGITRRRQLLKYLDLHSTKLNPPTKAIEPKQAATAAIYFETAERPVIDPVVGDADKYRDTKSIASGSNLNPSTKATTFVPQAPIVIEEIQSVADTASSYQSTLSGHEIIQIPPRPKGLDGEELDSFECPYCHVLCEIQSWQMWK